jgi:transcriptional regulator with XRE-family HTH domain
MAATFYFLFGEFRVLQPIQDADKLDVEIGGRLRQARKARGLSQTQLGESIGVTFQQIQKYERGSNRIGSSRLFEFAKVLDVPVSYFFDEMPSNALAGRPMSGRGRKGGFGEAATPFEQEKDPLIKRETLELVRAYYKIREGRVRKRIFEMVKAVGAASHAEVLGGRKGRSKH